MDPNQPLTTTIASFTPTPAPAAQPVYRDEHIVVQAEKMQQGYSIWALNAYTAWGLSGKTPFYSAEAPDIRQLSDRYYTIHCILYSSGNKDGISYDSYYVFDANRNTLYEGYEYILYVQDGMVVALSAISNEIPRLQLIVDTLSNADTYRECFLLPIAISDGDDPLQAVSGLKVEDNFVQVTYRAKDGVQVVETFQLGADLPPWYLQYYEWYLNADIAPNSCFSMVDSDFDDIPELIHFIDGSGGFGLHEAASYQKGAIRNVFPSFNTLYLCRNKNTGKLRWLAGYVSNGVSYYCAEWRLYGFGNIQKSQTQELLTYDVYYSDDIFRTVKLSVYGAQQDTITYTIAEWEKIFAALKSEMWAELLGTYDIVSHKQIQWQLLPESYPEFLAYTIPWQTAGDIAYRHSHEPYTPDSDVG